MSNEYIQRDEIKNLPDKPGVYKFFDKSKELIYVGKAKSLKKRVSNYFNKQANLDRKTQRLVSQIASIEYTIVNSEFDAYLLENNLIKNHQPKYNILLKDDKTYPYVCITKERFPRLFNTRTFNKDWGTYYGPYSSVKAINTITELARDLYQLRTCNYLLSEENITNHKYKVCLEYHIGNCKGPCENLQSEEEYKQNIEQVHQILKGNISSVRNHFQTEMQKAAESLDFEKAELFKQKINLLTKFQASSVIVNPKVTDLAVFTVVSKEKYAAVNCLIIREGRIVYTRTLTVKKKLNEPEDEILLMAIATVQNDTGAEPVEILSNVEVESEIGGIKIIIPRIGDKKKLIDLSVKNASEQLLQKSLREKEDPGLRVIKKLQEDLSLQEIPKHIECFDNSNIQGTSPVAAMVCFLNGKPAKKEYRHYNIKTVIGPDDFGSMREIVFRRYKRLVDEEKELPQLIVIDGGKGQLNAACDALKELNLYGQIPIIGIAKRLEEIFYPGDKDALYIDKKSESLRLLQFIRNEAHRFAITFHRQKRSGGTFKSSLSEIPGIGDKTYEKLIRHFKSPKRIKEAEYSELVELIGKVKANEIVKFYNNQSL